MALNDLGEQIFERPVSMPRLNLPAYDDSEERRELAAKLARERTVRAGAEAWAEISKLGSFSAWCKIGAALAIGRDHALRTSGASAPMGRPYSWTFSAWCRKHGFGSMSPAIRSWCLALNENLAAITAWRDSLPTGRGRRRPVNPQSCVKGWQKAQANGNGHARTDWQREAISAWKRFCFCVEALSPADQTAMWAMVYQTKAVPDVVAA
jgi:hypothetical protein